MCEKYLTFICRINCSLVWLYVTYCNCRYQRTGESGNIEFTSQPPWTYCNIAGDVGVRIRIKVGQLNSLCSTGSRPGFEFSEGILSTPCRTSPAYSFFKSQPKLRTEVDRKLWQVFLYPCLEWANFGHYKFLLEGNIVRQTTINNAELI